jgi:hypothetical protein
MTRRILGLLVTLAFLGLLVSHELLAGSTGGRPRGEPILIGALNASWGSTPQVVGLRDGLMALGYVETE